MIQIWFSLPVNKSAKVRVLSVYPFSLQNRPKVYAFGGLAHDSHVKLFSDLKEMQRSSKARPEKRLPTRCNYYHTAGSNLWYSAHYHFNRILYVADKCLILIDVT